ncbi:hypothetical protein HQ529_00350 [Candidatus Woesearchaeota archaeon]|nr:hypothetical protein [Candidatus Woesearchaeota archaeon]
MDLANKIEKHISGISRDPNNLDGYRTLYNTLHESRSSWGDKQTSHTLLKSYNPLSILISKRGNIGDRFALRYTYTLGGSREYEVMDTETNCSHQIGLWLYKLVDYTKFLVDDEGKHIKKVAEEDLLFLESNPGEMVDKY